MRKESSGAKAEQKQGAPTVWRIPQLILDEATSTLDHESERVVQENMRAMSSGRTVIIIAHRLAAVRGADRIITVERGRVVEDGTHEELVRSSGRYAGLWQHQLGAVTKANVE